MVKVRPGYARNYLLPRKLGVMASEDNKKLMVRRRARLDAEEAERNKELEVRIEALAGLLQNCLVRHRVYPFSPVIDAV